MPVTWWFPDSLRRLPKRKPPPQCFGTYNFWISLCDQVVFESAKEWKRKVPEDVIKTKHTTPSAFPNRSTLGDLSLSSENRLRASMEMSGSFGYQSPSQIYFPSVGFNLKLGLCDLSLIRALAILMETRT